MSSFGDPVSTLDSAINHLNDSDLSAATSSIASSSSSSTDSFPCQTTSPIWKYCRIEEGKALPAAWVDSNGRKWWHCQPCFNKKREKRYNYSGGSSTIIDHLRKEHRIMVPGRQDNRRATTQSRLGDITTFMTNDTLVHSKKRKATAEGDMLDQATLRELYCRYTVACSLPFAHVEHPAFRDFIRYLRPAADDLLPRSANTVKADLQWGYDNKKEFVKRALQNALSSVHIVPDSWTSPNCLGVIGFTVQFVTEDHGLQSLVVRIKELEGQHSGENMAEAIMEFIREYGIVSKVGYFMMDNASNMNTMIDKVSDDLEHEFDVFYDPLPHRLRCFVHIINLAVMEFLIGKRPPTTDSYRGPQAITIFCAQEPALQQDILTPSDWATLTETCKFLEPFQDATMANEGNRNSICDVLPTMDYIPHHIETSKEITAVPHLATMMETAWAKLADYYEATEDSPVYSAATVLNPSLKWAYMEKTWEDKNEWIEKAKARVEQLWSKTYKPTTPSPILRQSGEPEPTTRRPNGYKIWMKEQKATILNMDDDEYERGSMNIETLNLLECLRSWDRSALIAQSEHGYVAPAATDAMPDV
ncbi:hypothetical protein FOBRF1_013139 [Fusarium oxysporum]